MSALSIQEIKEFTSASTKDGIKKVLDRAGIGYLEDAKGFPRTTWEAINARLIAKIDNESEPNWDKFNA